MHTFQHQFIAVAIPACAMTLRGQLYIPPDANGVVLFAQGGGSGQHNPRDQRVAESLHHVGLATLLFDLVPRSDEPVDGFSARIRDTAQQAERLRAATLWARQRRELIDLPIGYFGASDGAAAVLTAAAIESANIQAVVTRGGYPNLADTAILKLRAPTLLIVGGNDEAAAAVNLEAWARMRCEKSIEIIPGAGHFFEEPGALDNLAALTARWFSEHLRKAANVAA